MICPDCEKSTEKGMVLMLRGQNKEGARLYRGEMFLAHPEKYFDKVPCPRCNGSGIAYCCDGEDPSRDSATLYGDQAVVKEARAALN